MNISGYSVTNAPIFSGISEKNAEKISKCFNAKFTYHDKGEIILSTDVVTERIGVIISGFVLITQTDLRGNRNIISIIGEGGVFAEAFAWSGTTLDEDVEAGANCIIMWLDTKKFFSRCANACKFHDTFISNLQRVMAAKTLNMNLKIKHISQRSTRDKLLSFLSSESKKNGGGEFTITFSRQQLADYLCVDRSAMCAELSKLQKDGVINYNKNKFVIK